MIIKAKKSLGQNFLFDKNILNIIVNCADIKEKNVLEIGPGTGNLTIEIIKKKPKKFFLIEKDKDLLFRLKEKYSEKITYINDDVLRINENVLSEEKLTKWILNLNSKIWFDKLILMFQKEVADRIISKFNTSSYGRLSIICNWKLNIKKIIDIKPNSFWPKPKVDSTLLVFTPKKKFFELKSPKSIENVTRVFFNQKRKKIKKPFNQLFDDANQIAEKLKINLDLRPQNLNHQDYYSIAKVLEKLRN